MAKPEIHHIVIDGLNESSTSEISSKTTGTVIGGYGGVSSSTQSRTVNTSQLRYNGRQYELQMANYKAAFQPGDEIIGLVQKRWDGAYQLSSYINLTNGTQFFNSGSFMIFGGIMIMLCSLMFFIQGLGVGLFFGIPFILIGLFFMLPGLIINKKSRSLKNLKGVASVEEAKERLKNFNGKVIFAE